MFYKFDVKLIEYTLGDERKVQVTFESKENETIVTEVFEAEDTHSIELPHNGWQAILENFKKYVEEKMKLTDQKITPFLWFDNQAKEAASFYTSVFKNGKITAETLYSDEGARAAGMPKGAIMTMAFQIEGYDFVAINGGPIFKISPVISFFVHCDSEKEIDTLWQKLSEGGTVMMQLDKYPFSEKYGWIQDKFGLSWQLIIPGRTQKIAPCFMFVGDQHLKAEEAINFYTGIFENSSIIHLEKYGAGQGPEGGVVHCRFELEGQEFVAMDSHMQMPYNFSPAISMLVGCKNQEELDYYWNKLSEGGDESAQQCGWLKDKYGVSWQVIPDALGQMMGDADPKKAGRAMQAMMQMKKIDIKGLEDAFNNA